MARRSRASRCAAFAGEWLESSLLSDARWARAFDFNDDCGREVDRNASKFRRGNLGHQLYLSAVTFAEGEVGNNEFSKEVPKASANFLAWFKSKTLELLPLVALTTSAWSIPMIFAAWRRDSP